MTLALLEEPEALLAPPQTHVGFVAETIAPPARFVGLLGAMQAAMRNPIELWDRDLFSLRSRIIHRVGQRYVEIMDPELMHAILVQHSDAFRKSDIQQRYIKPALGNGLLAAEGRNWRIQRPAAAPCFRPAALAELAPSVDRVGKAAARRFLQHDGAIVDVMPILMAATFEVVAELLLGPDVHLIDQATMEQAVTDYVETIALADPIDVCGGTTWLKGRPWPARGRRGLAAMRQEAMTALAGRRRITDSRSDLLARLLAARHRDSGAGMDDVDLRDNILTFLTAGNETTALTLTFALYLIANDPVVQDRLVEESERVLGDGPLTAEKIKELTLHLCVIKEALRLYPPIAILQRRALKPLRLGEVDIRKGDEVVCASYVMHRSELLWDRPETFDPDRFSAARSAGRHKLALLPFGAGKHICIGMPLAFMETVGVLARIVRDVAFAPNPSHRIRPIMRLTVRPEGGMPLPVRQRC